MSDSTTSVSDSTRESERLTAVLPCIRAREASSLRQSSRPSSSDRYHCDQPNYILSAEKEIAIYNHRGTAEQWINEREYAL